MGEAVDHRATPSTHGLVSGPRADAMPSAREDTRDAAVRARTDL
jgi:hypothetical protein